MRLTPAQLAQFERDGYLFFPSSGSNMSPWNRNIVYLSLCAVSNHIRRFKRPEYIAHRDFAPLEALPDDCLSAMQAA